jgi:hypothetical protein
MPQRVNIFYLRDDAGGLYARALITELRLCIDQFGESSDNTSQFWGIIASLIDWGLSLQYIDYSKKRLVDNQVSFNVPTANLYQFYRGLDEEKALCRCPSTYPPKYQLYPYNLIYKRSLLEHGKYHLPFWLEPKTFTRRLLRNTSHRQKTVRYRGKPCRGVEWGISVGKYQRFNKGT